MGFTPYYLRMLKRVLIAFNGFGHSKDSHTVVSCQFQKLIFVAMCTLIFNCWQNYYL
jgi:hypothetical protein